FALSFALWRIVSLSSILAVTTFAVAQCVLLRPHPLAEAHWSLGLFSLAAPALIIFRHRANIGRLLRGEEPRYESARGSRPE
ncbi:MAG: acyl-phosphate glycerol 3-phosphate acyltransferase, partial [Planctomycetaceae bacterium]